MKTKKSKSKIFVLDTNVILHDYQSVKQFQDNDIVIPIAVIEELDKFKKGDETINFNARAFMRDLSELVEGQKAGPRGVPLGEKKGCLKVEPNHPFAPEFQELFRDDIQDHRILSTAMWVRDNNPDRFVALVTKDINLRLKAVAAGMEAQDYLTDRMDNEVVDAVTREVIEMEASSEALQRLCYGQDNAIPWLEVGPREPAPNQLYKLSLIHI